MTDSEDKGARTPFPPGLKRFLAGEVPEGPAAEPRAAATVVLLRDGADGLETYLVQRARGMKFLGGAHVFPGGRVDAEDDGPEGAAVREVEEEVDVRLGREELVRWSRWVTPEVEPRRFDALFFVARVPEGQEARAVEGEITEGVWLAPAEAVSRSEAGRMILAPPTLWTLLELGLHGSVDDVLAAGGGEVEAFRPRPHLDEAGRLVLFLAGDPGYDDAAAEAPPEVQRRFILDGGRWIVRGAPA
jgi:8-oxo-dGTP pyrophosphatase MutT (NUDIX family)